MTNFVGQNNKEEMEAFFVKFAMATICNHPIFDFISSPSV